MKKLFNKNRFIIYFSFIFLLIILYWILSYLLSEEYLLFGEFINKKPLKQGSLVENIFEDIHGYNNMFYKKYGYYPINMKELEDKIDSIIKGQYLNIDNGYCVGNYYKYIYIDKDHYEIYALNDENYFKNKYDDSRVWTFYMDETGYIRFKAGKQPFEGGKNWAKCRFKVQDIFKRRYF